MTEESPKLPKIPSEYYTPSDVRQVLEEVRALASEHHMDYAAGMRNSCVEIEQRLRERKQERGDTDDNS